MKRGGAATKIAAVIAVGVLIAGGALHLRLRQQKVDEERRQRRFAQATVMGQPYVKEPTKPRMGPWVWTAVVVLLLTVLFVVLRKGSG